MPHKINLESIFFTDHCEVMLIPEIILCVVSVADLIMFVRNKYTSINHKQADVLG